MLRCTNAGTPASASERHGDPWPLDTLGEQALEPDVSLDYAFQGGGRVSSHLCQGIHELAAPKGTAGMEGRGRKD